MHELRVLTPGGGHTVAATWEPETKTEDRAKAIFDQVMTEGGRMAYTKDPETEELNQIHEFDPKAATITIAAPLVGG